MALRKPEWLNRLVAATKTKKGKSTLAMIGKSVLTVGLVLVLTVCIVACVLTVYVAVNFTGKTPLPDIDAINENQTSIVMTLNESTGEYEEFQRLSGIKRIWTPMENIPQDMQDAIVAIEDERFHTHFGVDWKRTISAFANLVLHFNSTEYGGSTLTQQLIKVMTGNDDHSVQRKITEIISAVEMEKYYSKEEILQAYLNMMPLSSNVTGVGAGANYFFGKEVEELSLAECAALASITNNPAKYNPYRYPENLRSRQRLVLRKMLELNFITADEYQQAMGEELHFTSSAKSSETYDWYTDLLIDEVTYGLMDTYGYTEAHARNIVSYGGLTIYSCENPTLQAKVEAVYANEDNYPAKLKNDVVQPQAAIYVMDYSGKTVAVVGGRGKKDANRILNRATASVRQPGSSMKPISVYAPAVLYNMINFSSPVPDCYITLSDGTKWPKNYNQSKPTDSGMTTIDVAVQTSMNTVAAQLVQQMTPARSFGFVSGSLNLTSLVTKDEDGNTDIDYAPMALGGLTKGAIPREMAAAYQMFGNGGYYNKPYCYTKVTQNGRTLLQHDFTPVQVLDEDSAYVMNRLLQTVVRGTNGATAGALKASWGEWEIFAKTGTTQQNNDVWLVAGTPKYVAASWFGYDKNQVLTNKQTSAARNLWNKSMLALHEGIEEPIPFIRKGSTEEHAFCAESGLLATEHCKKTRIGVYKPNQLPATCDKHKPAAEGGEIPAQ